MMRWISLLAALLFWASTAQAVTLTWNASVPDDTHGAAAGYRLSYGRASGVYDTVLDTGLATSAVVDGLLPDTPYFFAASAYNSAGESGYSNELAVLTPPADTTPPTVAITSPTDGSTVRRKSTVTVEAQASDDSGVARVALYVNGTLLCQRTQAPYQCSWSVPAAGGGRTYMLEAHAVDMAGNSAVSPPVMVTGR